MAPASVTLEIYLAYALPVNHDAAAGPPAEFEAARLEIEKALGIVSSKKVSVDLPLLVGLFIGQLICLASLAALTRGGLGLRLIGAASGTPDGSEISRRAAAWRATLAWCPWLVLQLAYVALFVEQHGSSVPVDPMRVWQFWVALAMIAVIVLGWISAAIRPEQGLWDRLAGVWVVPK